MKYILLLHFIVFLLKPEQGFSFSTLQPLSVVAIIIYG